jgi:hypothetical protein
VAVACARIEADASEHVRVPDLLIGRAAPAALDEEHGDRALLEHPRSEWQQPVLLTKGLAGQSGVDAPTHLFQRVGRGHWRVTSRHSTHEYE